MAQKKATTTAGIRRNVKKKRKGVQAKTKSSKNKRSTNYQKPYVGQG